LIRIVEQAINHVYTQNHFTKLNLQSTALLLGTDVAKKLASLVKHNSINNLLFKAYGVTNLNEFHDLAEKGELKRNLQDPKEFLSDIQKEKYKHDAISALAQLFFSIHFRNSEHLGLFPHIKKNKTLGVLALLSC
jgi:hypothetical protein